MAHGGKRPGAGRPKGASNKIPMEVREGIKDLVDRNAPAAQEKLNEIDDPAQWTKAYQGYLEHCLPKLARQEKSISDASDEELLAEIRRRAAQRAADADPESQ